MSAEPRWRNSGLSFNLDTDGSFANIVIFGHSIKPPLFHVNNSVLELELLENENVSATDTCDEVTTVFTYKSTQKYTDLKLPKFSPGLFASVACLAGGTQTGFHFKHR